MSSAEDKAFSFFALGLFFGCVGGWVVEWVHPQRGRRRATRVLRSKAFSFFALALYWVGGWVVEWVRTRDSGWVGGWVGGRGKDVPCYRSQEIDGQSVPEHGLHERANHLD